MNNKKQERAKSKLKLTIALGVVGAELLEFKSNKLPDTGGSGSLYNLDLLVRGSYFFLRLGYCGVVSAEVGSVYGAGPRSATTLGRCPK